MENENCLDCLYANYDRTALLLAEFTDGEHRKCEHPNSPYFGEFVSDGQICRLFLNEKEYYRDKDLREKLIKLKSKKK
jgi:hypothetical protein